MLTFRFAISQRMPNIVNPLLFEINVPDIPDRSVQRQRSEVTFVMDKLSLALLVNRPFPIAGHSAVSG
jgi:hypothetical protein